MHFRFFPLAHLFVVLVIMGTYFPANAGAVSNTSGRIASVNICIDQLLWQMVPPERLVSVSYLTADPRWSSIASEVSSLVLNTDLVLNHGLAEEIIPLQPDIVLAGRFDNPDSMRLLQKLGVNVQHLPIPNVLSELSLQVTQLGELVGMQQQAALMANRIEKKLQELAAVKQPATALTAFWYSSNGVVIGDGTLEHELMQLAGLRNLAAEQGRYGFNPLDMELLLAAKPDVLILEESQAEAFSLAKEYLLHPALDKAEFKVIHLPAGLSGCSATVVGDVVVALQEALGKTTSTLQQQ